VQARQQFTIRVVVVKCRAEIEAEWFGGMGSCKEGKLSKWAMK
jgi:hypothetical protein